MGSPNLRLETPPESCEDPCRVLTRLLCLAEGMRDERRVVRIQRGDRIGVACRPGVRPAVDPGASCGVRVYFATSIARLSRITITFTWPGYSS